MLVLQDDITLPARSILNILLLRVYHDQTKDEGL